MDISAPAFSLADRPRTGHLGYQGSQAPGRPVLHFVSSSRRPRRETGLCHRSLLIGAVPLFVPWGRSFVPARTSCGASRAGDVKAGRRAWLSTTLASPGHALTVPSTVPRSRRPGRHHICPGTFEVTSLVENRPGDTGELVGERDRQHVVVQPRLRGFDPRLEPVALPALWPDQYHPGRLHEQDAQVAIAALGYLAEDGAVCGRYLSRHQSEPGGEVAAFGEHIAGADRGDHGARNDRSDAGHRHQTLARWV